MSECVRGEGEKAVSFITSVSSFPDLVSHSITKEFVWKQKTSVLGELEKGRISN